MTEAPPAMPTLNEAMGWIGGELRDIDGERAGEVYGFFVDAEGGAPAWLIARVGRRRHVRLVAVPLRDCAGTRRGAWVAHEAEELKGAPVVDPARPLLREHELAICEHFGIGAKVGRAAEVAARSDGQVTARPA